MKRKLRFAKPCRLCGSINGLAKFVTETQSSKLGTVKNDHLCVHYEAVEGVIWPANHLTPEPK